FHECMSGFEHQVASHMMAEGMTDESLVITRMIHDRYHAAKRNPFNEIECSDHYARAMASYGTFISACGFEYHGPKGYIRFAPKISPENFRAPFVTAQGWGTYSQHQNKSSLKAQIHVKSGTLALKMLGFETTQDPTKTSVMLGNKLVPSNFTLLERGCTIELDNPIVISQSEKLEIEIY
ncbi:MAG: glycoside hydrolase family 116 protein, partial [Cyclobacteriaceae bacterium]|nr:glycoside hydrolase family 116 protein [Cyclobacteriaceae bacterium]